MKTVVIIPIYNQYENIEKILSGLSKQTVKPDKILFVIDRVNGNDSSKIHEVGLLCKDVAQIAFAPEYAYSLKRRNDGFFAAHIRNYGISMAKEFECVILIDGDCVPQETLVESHATACKSACGSPVINIGRRREKQHNWKDQREVDRNLSMVRIFRLNDYVVSNPFLLTTSSIVWSCNMSLNKSAIDRISKFNLHSYDRSEVFNSDFNGGWGGEDGFLGITANRAGIPIQILSAQDSGVMHIDHERGYLHDSNIHLKYMDSKITELNEILMRKPLDISFYT